MEGACAVLDLGSGWVKAELATAEAPRLFHNVVGQVKHKSLLADDRTGLIGGSLFASTHADDHRGIVRTSYPMEHGHVSDWEGQGHVIKHVMGELGVNAKDHPVLLTEAPLADRQQRNRLAQIMFEEHQHPALLFSVQAVLSLYSSGEMSGLVLDVGDGVTHACPVFEGYSIREAVQRVDFGGRDVTKYLQTLLRQHGTRLDSSAEFEICREIKEQRCSVAQSKETRALDAKVIHRLPDGTEVSLGSELRQAPELLFDPSLHGFEAPSVVQVAMDAIRRTDVDVRKCLYESIFLSGGTTLLPKFCDRFVAEAAAQTPRYSKVKVKAPAERRITAWIGGSFLSQLSTFKSMATRRSEYIEQGERILHSRLFA